MLDIMEGPKQTDMDTEKIVYKETPGHVHNMIALFTRIGNANKRVRTYSRSDSRNSSFRGSKGSEPSLATRNGGPKGSSVNASKRTLTSQDNAVSPHNKSHTTHSSQSDKSPITTQVVPNRQLSNTSNASDNDDVFSDPNMKSPSYLKIACSVGGYNVYKTQSNGPLLNNNLNGDIKGVETNSESTNLRTRNSSSGSGKQEVVENGPVSLAPASDNFQHTNGALNGDISSGEDCVDGSRLIGESVSNADTSDMKLPLVNGGEMKTPAKNSTVVKDSPSPGKDGHHYLSIMNVETTRITAMCEVTEKELQGNLSDEVQGKIRACIGKANLLTTRKFKQFRGLCEQNNNPVADEPFQTTCGDLAGFWDMVLLQVDDVNSLFAEIETLKQNNWKEPQNDRTPVRSLSSGTPGSAHRKGKGTSPSKPKSAKAQEAAKAREEARKKLLAAKRAGRQRKSSQNDKEQEIEIFVPQ